VKIPTQFYANLCWRELMLAATPESKALQNDLKEASRQDPCFWINTFVYQFNPQRVGFEVGPFVLWPFQEEAVREIVKAINTTSGRTDLIIEKSREMGASWLCLIVMTWLFLFHPWKKFLVISRNEEAVDKPEEPDCLFWKIDFILSYLPDWMVPDGMIRRRKRGFRNTANGSTITGQASTGKAGVGGRATAMFIDEFSQIDDDFEVLRRTADTTSCRIFNFTHKSLDTAAYELSMRADVRKLRMHWSMHPEKNQGLYRWDQERNIPEPLDRKYHFPPDYQFVTDGSPGGPFAGLRSPWYDYEERRRNDKRAVAMDLDIDPRGATHQFFNGPQVKRIQMEYACDPFWMGELHIDRDRARPLDLVEHPEGRLFLWRVPNHKGRLPRSQYAIGCDVATGTGATPSCVSIFDARTSEKIGRYANPFIQPKEFAHLVVALCWFFVDEDDDGARLCWESHGPGAVFGNEVIGLGYRNVFMRISDGLGKKQSDLPGWVPSVNNIRILLEEYRSALENKILTNRDWQALDECLSFEYGVRGRVHHGKYELDNDPTGARENHGDLVIADSLAWKMCLELVNHRATRPEEKDEIPVLSLAWRREYNRTQSQLEERWA
jgi:hypothetical protein